MKILFVLVTVIMSMTFNIQTKTIQPQGVSKSEKTTIQKNSGYTHKIIPAANKTWGYDIYKEKHLLIHQPCIPGLPGNEGFKSKTDAEKVARLVIEKIKKGEMPPTITLEELKKLKVL